MKATYQIKHCGGRREANHADRTFDVNKAKNIKSVKDDRAYVFDGEDFRRVHLGRGSLAKWEQGYYEKRFSSYIDHQKGKYLKNRQKKRAENCTIESYYNSHTTGPTHMLYQVGANGEYQEYEKFREMVFEDIKHICENYQTDTARITCLDVAIHGYDGAERSLHAHTAWSFEVRDKNGNWVQNTEKCLERLGVELPDKTKSKGRYNNRKMSFTKDMQEKWYDIVEEIDKSVKIDRTPALKPITNSHRAQQCIYEMGEIVDSIKAVQALLSDLDKSINSLNRKDRQKRLEEVHNAVENCKHKFGNWQEKYMLKEEEILPVSDMLKDMQTDMDGLKPDEDWEC